MLPIQIPFPADFLTEGPFPGLRTRVQDLTEYSHHISVDKEKKSCSLGGCTPCPVSAGIWWSYL